jgi:hypothetical protein
LRMKRGSIRQPAGTQREQAPGSILLVGSAMSCAQAVRKTQLGAIP